MTAGRALGPAVRRADADDSGEEDGMRAGEDIEEGESDIRQMRGGGAWGHEGSDQRGTGREAAQGGAKQSGNTASHKNRSKLQEKTKI